tara:strand:- start:53 stop:295 length:243 start_codon:yes stop_codon:yes gene_type:complete
MLAYIQDNNVLGGGIGAHTFDNVEPAPEPEAEPDPGGAGEGVSPESGSSNGGKPNIFANTKYIRIKTNIIPKILNIFSSL